MEEPNGKQPVRQPPTKLEDIQVVQTEQSEEDLLMKCKMAILDLTEELERERRKVSELQQHQHDAAKFKARNEHLERERKEYMRENALLRYFIASLEDKSAKTTQPIDVLIAAHKQVVNPEEKQSATKGSEKKHSPETIRPFPQIIHIPPPNMSAEKTPASTAQKTPAKQNAMRSQQITSSRKYRYLL